MEFLALIDVLEEMVENAARVPFSNKCMLDRDDLLDIIREPAKGCRKISSRPNGLLKKDRKYLLMPREMQIIF